MTVWRTMNGKSAVSTRLRLKVARALAALHYAPNHPARNLAGTKLMRICVLHDDMDAGFLGEFLLNLYDQSVLNNVSLIVQKRESGGERGCGTNAVGSKVDGIILLPSLYKSSTLTDVHYNRSIPAVVIGHASSDEDISVVHADDYKAAYEMTSHLVRLGHRRIGFIAGIPDDMVGGRRLAGYRAAVADAGVDVSDDLVVHGNFTYHSGLDTAERLLCLPNRPTAIFASSDSMAAAAMTVALRLDLSVPGDLSVTGFDDTVIASTTWPALTTLRYPIDEMARVAMHGLVHRVRALREGRPLLVEQSSMNFKLVRRGSDAVPRRAKAVPG